MEKLNKRQVYFSWNKNKVIAFEFPKDLAKMSRPPQAAFHN